MLYSSGLKFSWHCPLKAKIWHLELAHSLLFYHRWLKWWDKPIYIILEIKWYKWLGMSRAGNALLQIINTAAFAGMQFTLCYRVISKLCASANIYHLKTVELINQQSYFLRYFCHWGITEIGIMKSDFPYFLPQFSCPTKPGGWFLLHPLLWKQNILS